MAAKYARQRRRNRHVRMLDMPTATVVTVPATMLWVEPTSPREVDAPAVTAHPDVRGLAPRSRRGRGRPDRPARPGREPAGARRARAGHRQPGGLAPGHLPRGSRARPTPAATPAGSPPHTSARHEAPTRRRPRPGRAGRPARRCCRHGAPPPRAALPLGRHVDVRPGLLRAGAPEPAHAGPGRPPRRPRPAGRRDARPVEDVQAGDLLFFARDGQPAHHVGIATGDGRHAARPRDRRRHRGGTADAASAGSRSVAPGGSPRRPTTRGDRRVPAPLLVLTAVVSVQFGGALAATLVPRIGAAGSVALRLVLAAAVLLAVARPRLRGRTRADWLTVCGVRRGPRPDEPGLLRLARPAAPRRRGDGRVHRPAGPGDRRCPASCATSSPWPAAALGVVLVSGALDRPVGRARGHRHPAGPGGGRVLGGVHPAQRAHRHPTSRSWTAWPSPWPSRPCGRAAGAGHGRHRALTWDALWRGAGSRCCPRCCRTPWS